MVSYHFALFGFNGSSGKGYITFVICRMISRCYLIKRLFDFMDEILNGKSPTLNIW